MDVEFHDLLFGVRRSIRYHARRIVFFDALYKWTQAGAVVTGSATVAFAVSSYAGAGVTAFLAAMVAVFSALNLVFRFAESARIHSDFVQKYTDLEKRMTALKNQTAETARPFVLERLAIEAMEPPVLRTLDMICHNELCRAMGHDRSKMVKISPAQRIFAQLFDLMDHKIEAPKPC